MPDSPAIHHNIVTGLRSILLVDESPLVCDSLIAILERAFSPERVTTAHTLAAAMRLAGEADLVITDLSLPDATDREIVPTLAARLAPGARIIVVAERARSADVEHAIAAGASGVLLKTTDVRGFQHAIENVTAGNLHLQPELGAALYGPDSSRAARARHDLEETEVRLLALIAHGFTNRQSAKRENVSLRTIESRRARLQVKLGCQGRAALTRRAYDLGLVAV
jgi:DNA-binding NarL/FixJ family response regulator